MKGRKVPLGVYRVYLKRPGEEPLVSEFPVGSCGFCLILQPTPARAQPADTLHSRTKLRARALALSC